MDEKQDKPSGRSWTKITGVAFAVYLASFGALMVADDNGMVARPPNRFIRVVYAPVIWFYSLVSRGLK